MNEWTTNGAKSFVSAELLCFDRIKQGQWNYSFGPTDGKRVLTSPGKSFAAPVDEGCYRRW